jgi:DNA-binding IclR family transcriptional regulator
MKIVRRAFDLLALLRRADEMRLAAIAGALGIRSNSAWNLLNFLKEIGYVEKRSTGKYTLGSEFQRLVETAPEDIGTRLARSLSRLSGDVKESCVAAKLGKARLEVLRGVDYEREIMVSARLYEAADAIYSSAVGHVLLANHGDTEVRAVVESNGMPKASQWSGVQTRRNFNAELSRIRSAGFSERLDKAGNIYSIAVPVLRKGGAPLALGVSCPSFRCTATQRRLMLSSLRSTAALLAKSA